MASTKMQSRKEKEKYTIEYWCDRLQKKKIYIYIYIYILTWQEGRAIYLILKDTHSPTKKPLPMAQTSNFNDISLQHFWS